MSEAEASPTEVPRDAIQYLGREEGVLQWIRGSMAFRWVLDNPVLNMGLQIFFCGRMVLGEILRRGIELCGTLKVHLESCLFELPW